MNKIIKHTTLFFLLLSCGIAHGQTGILYNVPLPGRSQIVRYHPGSGKHIVYSESLSGDNMFSITDMQYLVKVRVHSGLKVKDFEIIDGMVFYCGDNGSGSGFLGCFDIDSLFYMGGTVQLDETLSLLGLHSLDNIAVYHDTTGGIRIAGYGESAPNQYRAFEAVGIPTTGMQYRTLELWSTGIFGAISDVVVTDHFVVYLQPVRNQVCVPNVGIGIEFQPFPKYDMFGTPPYFYHYFQLSYMAHKYDQYGNSYVVPINNDPYNNSTGEVYPKMVHSVEDEIAVCTYRHELDDNLWTPDSCSRWMPATVAYITNIKFDLSQLVPNTNNFITMTKWAIAKLPDTSLYSIDGFEYEPQSDRYIVLHRHKTSVGMDEHALTTFKYPSAGYPAYVASSYQTAYNTINNWMPTGMCVDGYLYYMVAGYDQGTGFHILWYNSVGNVGGGCERIVQYPVSSLPLGPEKYYENNARPTIWKPLLFDRKTIDAFEEVPCTKICD